MLPITAELVELRDVLLKHALGPKADRQCDALEYIFGRIIKERENCKYILPKEIADIPTPPDEKQPDDPKRAAHGLIRDIGLKLDAFYGEGRSSGKVPHPESRNVKYRVDFIERGNYMLTFRAYIPKQPEPDLVPFFWRPHLLPLGVAKILYPEPFFLIDGRETYFRNSDVGTRPDFSALDYLNIPGPPLRTGYSYVPSGIVQAMLLLTKALRFYDRQRPDFPAYEAVKPFVSIPPGDKDLILLATPSSTNLVATVQDGQRMVVDAKGVHYNGEVHNDTEGIKWGIVTRTRQSRRTVTMLAAKHGRSVEEMVKVLTVPEPLALLAQRMGRINVFPQTFQVLFRMPVADTGEGPVVKDAVIEDVFIPDEEEPQSPEPPWPY